jgi:hypothetical protein
MPWKGAEAGKAMNETIVITGAFSYTGKYATRILLERGYQVRTLTFHPHRRNPFAQQVEICPYNFDMPEELRRYYDREVRRENWRLDMIYVGSLVVLVVVFGIAAMR